MTRRQIVTGASIAARATISAQRRPLWGQIFITRRCNVRCPFCAAPRHAAKELSLAQWREILTRLHGWGVRWLNIVGGEPTLYQDLWAFLAAAANLGFLTVLHTNLHRPASDLVRRLVDAGVFALEVSFDSLDGSMPKSGWHNLELLETVKQRGVIPLACSVITSRNVHQIETIAERITTRRIMYIAAVYQHVGGMFSDSNLELVPNQTHLSRVLNRLQVLKRKTGLVRNSWEFLSAGCLDRGPQWHCDPSRDAWITIDSDGVLMACQEHKTTLNVLEVATLSSQAWREQKIRLAGACGGCSYHCYYEAESIRGWSAAREIAGYVRSYLNSAWLQTTAIHEVCAPSDNELQHATASDPTVSCGGGVALVPISSIGRAYS